MALSNGAQFLTRFKRQSKQFLKLSGMDFTFSINVVQLSCKSFAIFIVSRILLFRGYCEFYCFRVAQLIDLAEHPTSKPDVACSIPTAVKQTLQLARCEHIQTCPV
jgi:hypothetical protein